MVGDKTVTPVFSYRRTTEEDCAELLHNIREFSKNDLLIASTDGEEGLRAAVEASRDVYTALIDGKVGLIYGVRLINILSGHVYMWMVTTRLAEEYWVTFTRAASIYTVALLNEYNMVTSICPVKNKKSEKWLRFIGFQPGPVARMHGIKFKTFFLTRETLNMDKLNWFEGDERWQPLPQLSE